MERLLLNLAKQYGTPFYLFDEEALSQRVQKARSLLKTNIQLCYSIKANPFILPIMARLLDHIEVCSPGELIICEKQNLPMHQVVFSGVNKTEQDVHHAMEDGVGVFTAESPLHLEYIQKEATAHNKIVPVLLRLSSGNQFGMDQKTLEQLIQNRKRYSAIEFVGIHYFSGTQKKRASQILKELQNLDLMCQEWAERLQFTVQRIEFGPGLAVNYFDGNETNEYALLAEIAPKLNELSNRYAVTIEMGRWFASCCGTYVTSVADLKETNGTKYAIVDGGIHHLNYYGQMMAMQLPVIKHIRPSKDGYILEQAAPPAKENPDLTHVWTLCGSLCTVADVLVRQASFEHDLEYGDLLAFERCGAYSVTEAPALFLTRELPAVLLRTLSGQVKVLRHHISPDFLNCGAQFC